MGAPEQVSVAVAEHLVLSNLSGHDSHGVMRIPLYVDMADRGALQPTRLPEVLAESEATILVDAHRGFGQYSTLFTLERCMERAKAAGAAVGAVRHSTHTGRLGTYSEVAAARGLVSLVTTGSAGPGYGLVAPVGGIGRFMSTNPWAIGVPSGKDRAPFVYDAATTTIAEGKNQLARARGVPVPEGALLDSAGRATTDPEDLYRGGTMTPLGGSVASHKGYGYSLGAALLGALAMIGDPDPTPAGALEGFKGAGGVFMVVVDPGRFGPVEEYAGLVASTLDGLKRVEPAPGREVLYAGEPEARSRAARAAQGISLPQAVWSRLAEVARRFGVRLPA